jgi:hypothetical protein
MSNTSAIPILTTWFLTLINSVVALYVAEPAFLSAIERLCLRTLLINDAGAALQHHRLPTRKDGNPAISTFPLPISSPHTRAMW